MTDYKPSEPPIFKGFLDIEEAKKIMAEYGDPLPYQLYQDKKDNSMWRYSDTGDWVYWKELSEIVRGD